MNNQIPRPEYYRDFLRKFLAPILALILIVFPLAALHSEDMTITTYYPSPSGSYDALIAKRFAVGDVNGDSSINASDIPSTNGYLLVADRIGIRTMNPDAALKLESGGMAIGQAAATSDTDGNRRSLQITTDTNYGGTYNDHTGALIFSIMPGGWGTSELHFRNSNGWATYRSEDSMMISYDTTYIHGNVGIGTTSPGTLLHVYGNGGWNAGFRTEYSGGSGNGWNIVDGTDNNLYIGYGSSSAPSAKVVLQNGGNVGIGTTSPGAKLDVYASSSTWGGWYEALRFSNPSHSAITFPAGGLLFGLHSNRNFYWADTTNGWYSMYLTPDGYLTLRSEISGGNTSTGWALGKGAWGPDVWLRLTTTVAGSTYHNFACGPLWANGAQRYDLAEVTPVKKEDALEEGDAVVIDKADGLRVKRSTQAYDTMVYGIISSYDHASMVIGGHLDPSQAKANKDNAPVALVGRVSAKVSAENGPVQVGDLLTTSNTPGYLMRCGDSSKSAGAIAGKALQSLEKGKGMIKILVTLQ